MGNCINSLKKACGCISGLDVPPPLYSAAPLAPINSSGPIYVIDTPSTTTVYASQPGESLADLDVAILVGLEQEARSREQWRKRRTDDEELCCLTSCAFCLCLPVFFLPFI